MTTTLSQSRNRSHVPAKMRATMSLAPMVSTKATVILKTVPVTRRAVVIQSRLQLTRRINPPIARIMMLRAADTKALQEAEST